MIKNALTGLLFLLLITGCKLQRISYDLNGASIPAGTATAEVPYFQNRASVVQPMLSRNLTEELKDKIQSQTNLKLVNESGDAVFEGEITGYTVSPAAITGENIAAKNRLTISVRVKYSNSKDAQYDYDTTFSRFADFDSNQSIDAVESQLMEEISELLIEDIFNKAFVNW
ncbi:MAG: LptE family protein [Bacteroidales bacterium]|nr:LptE family protein [Bacteroidales bacterium]